MSLPPTDRPDLSQRPAATSLAKLRELMKNFHLKFASVNVVTAGVGALRLVLLARILSPAQFGIIAIVESILGIIGVLQGLGLDAGIAREVAVAKDPADISALMAVSALIKLAVNITVGALLILAMPMIARHYEMPELNDLGWLMGSLLVLEPITQLLDSSLRGLQRYDAYLRYLLIGSVLGFCLTIWLSSSFGVAGFYLARLLLAAACALVLAAPLKAEIQLAFLPATRERFRPALQNLRRMMYFVFSAKVGFSLWLKGPFLVAGSFLSAPILGAAHVVVEVVEKLLFLNNALYPYLTPRLSSTYAHKNEFFKQSVLKNLALLAGVSFALFFGAALFKNIFLGILIGASIRAEIATNTYYLILSAFFVYSLCQQLSICTLIPSGMVNNLSWLNILVLPCSILVSWIFLSYVPWGQAAIGLALLLPLLGIFAIYLQRSLVILNEGK